MSSDPSRSDPVALCVAPDADLRASICAALAALDLRIVECAIAEEALRAVREARPAIVITSASVAGLEEFLEECAGDGSASRVPWIQVGTSAECQTAAANGAEDWIVAPVIGPLLAFRVERVLRSARMERELVELRGEASFGESSTEAVISGPTPHERFMLRADGILRSPRQRRLDAAMLVVSVELGSAPSSDEMIPKCHAALGRRLREVVRAREGNTQAANAPATLLEGREFTLLLERQERVQESYKIARRIQQQLERPLDCGGEQVQVQVNIGIAVHLKDGTSATELCDVARKAMNGARQEQLHGIRFATGEMNSIMFERLALESSLRYALERNELVLFYQPRIDIRSCSIVGFEALVRWKHPELGMVSPGQFIPIAEESGLIVPIGEWVMREACRQNQAWRAAGLPHVRMAVNLSSVQFRQPDLELSIARVLEETGLDPSGLELELTESLLLQDADATIETLRTIKHMGIHMSIDDFGTGYSSLSYVKRFPVDALKIDQSFIRDVTTSPEDSAITTSIILMGKSLGLTVVAEGVETKSQLEFLRVLECDEVQGYLFSRPVPAKEAGDCLAAGYAAMVSTAA